MIIYGYYFKRIGFQGFRCADGTEMRIVIYCKIYHVMYIPIFAGYKVAVVENAVPTGEKFTPEAFGVEDDAQRFLHNTSKPWYSYIGSVLFMAFVLLMGITIFSSERDRKERKQNALDGLYEAQVITYKGDDDEYISCLVDSIAGDSIWLFETNAQSRKETILPKNTVNNYKLITRQQLQEMMDKGDIKSVTNRSSAYVLRDIDFGSANECVLYYTLPDNTYSSMRLDSLSASKDIFYFRKNRKTAKSQDKALKLNIPENYSDTLQN